MTEQPPQTYETEIDLWVRTDQGLEAYIKVAGVPHNQAAPTLAALSQLLTDKYNMTAAHRWSTYGAGERPPANGAPASAPPANGTPAAPAPVQAAPSAGPTPGCGNCGSDVYDNRGNKRNPKGPDFTCKNKSACGWRAWIQKDGGLNWKAPLTV